jgi:hypothetical protein
MWPKYPPYDTGPHLEARAIDRFRGRVIGGRRFIDCAWTPAINSGGVLSLHNPPGLMFSVSTHDDAPGAACHHPLVRHFAAGGNGGGEPIPLVCESEPPGAFVPLDKREHTVAFSGSDTHPLRRALIAECNRAEVDGPMRLGKWSPVIDDTTIRTTFHDLRRARFALCPRGYGPTSYRLYEAIRCGVVPVYVSDRHWLPWPDVLDWDWLAIVDTDPAVAVRRMVEMPDAEWRDRADYCLSVASLLTPDAVLSRVQHKLESS